MENNSNNIKNISCTQTKPLDSDQQRKVCPLKKFLESKKDFYVEQFNTGCLSQYCYYIECNGEAAIIDPLRDIYSYLEILQKRNAKLKYIFETHFHADFVSGHIDLSLKTGAEIIFGPTAKTQYKITVAFDGQEFKLGDLIIRVIHTPGHTLESSCYLLVDKENKKRVVFTGDTIFLGDVGRPDLAVKCDLSEKDLASYLFESIQKIKNLPDECIIFPGHGAGSACGKKIASGSGDSIKGQKEKNYAFSDLLSKKEFIELATSNLRTPPSYFFYDVGLNKQGYESIDNVLERSNKPIKPKEFSKILNSDVKSGSTVILDTRDFMVANKKFIKGAVIIPLKLTYAIWSATLFTQESKFILITEPGKEKESILRLARVGYEHVLGYLEGGIDEYSNIYPDDIVSIQMPSSDEINILISENKLTLIDVREKGEVETSGNIQNALFFPLSEFNDNLKKIKELNKPIGIYCKTGGRASIGASILIKNEIVSSNIYLLGGIDELINLGFKTDK